MRPEPPAVRELRTLVLAPTGRDTELTVQILRDRGVEAQGCADVGELLAELDGGAGLLILGKEALDGAAMSRLGPALAAQPPWSDLPLLVLGHRDEAVHRLASLFESTSNVSILERPIQIGTLLSAVRSARRARTRQYQVRDLVEDLETADRSKDRFLAMVSHELRNPLGAIRTSLELWRRRPGDVRQIERIERQVEHLTRLVADLLDVSRFSTGKMSIETERLDLVQLVLRSAEAWPERVVEREQRVRLRLPSGEVAVAGDPARLEQVLANLVENASKFSPRGAEIELRLQSDGGEAVLQVEDRGLGIDPRDLQRIFGSFRQLAATGGESSGGLGLGLALVRRIVQAHGGEVVARSEGVGTGTCFEVRLPLAAAAPAGRPETEAPSGRAVSRPVPVAHPPLRVLVVEDLEDTRRALGDLLRLSGHRVRLAADGESGLALLLESPPDVALVDIDLPGMDGYAVAREARRQGAAEIALVALTGFGSAADRERALAAGFDLHLVKPVPPDELLGIIAAQGAKHRPS